jgi:hypothetical protein
MTQSLKVRATVLLGAFALLCSVMAGAAVAGNPLSGDGIKMLMSDVTVEGKMNDGSSYSEFYEADGKIKAKDYAGNWTVEGNSMCFVYSSNPKKMCYQIGTNASGIDWIHDGKVEGTGTVVKGNVRKY